MRHQCVSALSSFFLPRCRVALNLALRLAYINTAKFEPTCKGKIKAGATDCRHNYELIRRNESGHRRGDELRLVNHGRHGPRLANAASVQDRAPSVAYRRSFQPSVNGATGTSDVEGKVARVSDERVGKRTSFKSAFAFCYPAS